jgi:hypothetical protein
MALYQVAKDVSRRLAGIFLRDATGRRPVRRGDDGSGFGGSHQTGWSGIAARAMHLFATTTPQQVLELGKAAAITEVAPQTAGRGGGRRRQ